MSRDRDRIARVGREAALRRVEAIAAADREEQLAPVARRLGEALVLAADADEMWQAPSTAFAVSEAVMPSVVDWAGVLRSLGTQPPSPELYVDAWMGGVAAGSLVGEPAHPPPLLRAGLSRFGSLLCTESRRSEIQPAYMKPLVRAGVRVAGHVPALAAALLAGQDPCGQPRDRYTRAMSDVAHARAAAQLSSILDRVTGEGARIDEYGWRADREAFDALRALNVSTWAWSRDALRDSATTSTPVDHAALGVLRAVSAQTRSALFTLWDAGLVADWFTAGFATRCDAVTNRVLKVSRLSGARSMIVGASLVRDIEAIEKELTSLRDGVERAVVLNPGRSYWPG